MKMAGELIQGKDLVQYPYAHTGVLKEIRYKMFSCADCGTNYPMIENKIMCNGQEIRKCPYCEV